MTAVLALAVGTVPLPLAAQAPPPAPIPMDPVTLPPPKKDPFPGATAAAVVVNVVRVPGKTMLCGLGTFAGAAILLGTFGSQYRAAGAVFREGCGGKWLIGPDDFDRDVEAPRAIYSGEGR